MYSGVQQEVENYRGTTVNTIPTTTTTTTTTTTITYFYACRVGATGSPYSSVVAFSSCLLSGMDVGSTGRPAVCMYVCYVCMYACI